MRNLIRIIAFIALSVPLFAQGEMTYTTTGAAFPLWQTYSVVKTAGNWLINSGNSQVAAAATTQAINLFTLPAGGYVHAVRIKTTTACSGITVTTLTGVGTSGTAALYATGLTYNLQTAVSATNILIPILAAQGSDTNSSTGVTVTISGAAQNISSIANGCAFDVKILWSVP